MDPRRAPNNTRERDKTPLTGGRPAHTVEAHGKEVVRRMNDFGTCEVTAS